MCVFFDVEGMLYDEFSYGRIRNSTDCAHRNIHICKIGLCVLEIPHFSPDF